MSVVIPTRERPGQLGRCLSCLAEQVGCPDFEVIVVLDGPDGVSAGAAAGWSSRLDLKVIEAARLGIAHAKNAALEAARGELVVLLNDDVLPEPGFLAAHSQAHQELGNCGAMVLGWSPWVVHAPDRLFDRVLRESSMIFFYDRMIDSAGRVLMGRDHDWGYRHAWNLNLSFGLERARRVGGFRAAIANCCFEDVEFAFRFTRCSGDGAGSPVLFRPEAVAPHDHRYEPAGYLEREFRLGYSAHGFAIAAPACAADLFGRDILSPSEVAYARAFVERESKSEAPVRDAFEALGAMPASMGDGEHGALLVRLAYTQHLMLKRLKFRRGLLAAVENRRIEGLFHNSDGLEARPGITGGATERAMAAA